MMFWIKYFLDNTKNSCKFNFFQNDNDNGNFYSAQKSRLEMKLLRFLLCFFLRELFQSTGLYIKGIVRVSASECDWK